MSGIYGIYRYDGAPVDPEWLKRMGKAMAYYGPHGGASKIDGAIGMGHLLLEVNPEDAFERQPIRGRRGLVVTSARLDNRELLLDTFEIPSAEAPRVPDGHLVSLAFDRWGDDVCTHLEGDWALAAWDAKERRLLLARDVFWGAGLYYHQGQGFVAFASNLKALLALPGALKAPNLLRLAEVLVSWQHNAELTAYDGLLSVLSAHRITIDSDGRKIERRYWSHKGREPLRYRRDEEYEETFLDLYGRAVRSCLRTNKPVAAALSAGRDSGSVVALAAPILAAQGRELTAYTSVPSLPPDGAPSHRLGDEWDLAHETAAMAGPNDRHVPIDARDYGVIGGIEHFLDIHGGPGHAAANHYWIQAELEASSRDCAGVFLWGSLGNHTVSWTGHGSALHALLAGNPASAAKLFFQGESSPWPFLKRQILKPLLVPAWRMVKRLKTPGSFWQSYSALNPVMGRTLDIDGRMRAAGHDSTFTWSPLEDPRSFFNLKFGATGSFFSDAGAWHSVCCTDPTSNLSLVEFLLRVPDDQFYRKGQLGSLLKRSFRNRMPEPVLHSTRKGLQGADLGHRILRELPAFEEALESFESLPEAKEMLDLPLMRHCLDDLVVKVTPESTDRAIYILVRGLGVGLFLRRLLRN